MQKRDRMERERESLSERTSRVESSWVEFTLGTTECRVFGNQMNACNAFPYAKHILRNILIRDFMLLAMWLRWGAAKCNIQCNLFVIQFIIHMRCCLFGFSNPFWLVYFVFAPSFVLINLFVEINEIDSYTKCDYSYIEILSTWFLFLVSHKFNNWSMWSPKNPFMHIATEAHFCWVWTCIQ